MASYEFYKPLHFWKSIEIIVTTSKDKKACAILYGHYFKIRLFSVMKVQMNRLNLQV